MYWFLYGSDLRHERIMSLRALFSYSFAKLMLVALNDAPKALYDFKNKQQKSISNVLDM